MEEKEVAMSGQTNPDENKTKKTKKMSYEELVNIAQQLNQQCQALARQNEELKMRLAQVDGIETRLHYLFKVLEFRSAFADPDYIMEITNEIREVLTLKENKDKEE